MTQDTTLLDSIDPEIMSRIATRREAIARGASASGAVLAGLALASVPIALGALARESFAQSPAEIRDVLQFALLLENLEAEFYKAVLGTSSSAAFNDAFAPVRGTLTSAEQGTFTLIRDHEIAHVALLRTTISALGGTPATYTPANFDFTGGKGSGTGPFQQATTSKAFLLAAAQGFEDTGVRAYKGQAGNLMSNDAVLETALRVHSVEARHAAKIRRLRRAAGAATLKPSGVITQSQSGISGVPGGGQAVVDMIYAGEENRTHNVFNGTAVVPVDATPFGSGFGGNDAVTEAFDEPLTRAQVESIVDPFLV